MAEPPQESDSPVVAAYSAQHLAQQEVQTLEHYAAMGRVANEWAMFEWTVDHSAVELADLHIAFAACLTAQVIGPRRKLEAYLAIAGCRNASATLLKNMRSLSDAACVIGDRRNRVLHDPWILISPKEKALRFEITAKRTLRAELVRMPTTEVNKLADDIKMLTQKFSDLHYKIRDEMPLPLPDTAPSPK